MAFRLRKTFTFEASHKLPNHDGKCQRLHGHSWVGAAIVEGDDLVEDGPKAGMLVDYSDLSAAVKDLVASHLDHWHLNDTTGLVNPTSEELARWLFVRLKARIPHLIGIEINETCTSRCEYFPYQRSDNPSLC